MRYIGHRASETNPLRSIPFMRPASTVLRWTDRETADWNLAVAVQEMPLAEARYASACAALGNANRMRGPMRRHWQAQAFRAINSARGLVRACRKKLAAAQIAMLQFAPAVAA